MPYLENYPLCPMCKKMIMRRRYGYYCKSCKTMLIITDLVEEEKVKMYENGTIHI
jgi:tRNA(Ile2) C34 agmatinyltransferase TiaS